ncbi:histidinol-phosphate transaminase [uncultured Clostridium sp.]|uniref:histidinol-phosphate transaminase n=1 Tax=uncultured Clostridium sp. TaxID=59620 RepID=UPI002627848D|nr:histidinol-phosphate transaminase [uncultured Clostridium sp.]
MKEIKEYKVEEDKKGTKINGNESFYDIGKEIIEEFKKIIETIDFNRYPENTGRELREKYGEYVGVDSENIIVGNGSDEVIHLVIRAFISKGKKILTLSPDFSMYDFYVEGNQGELIKFKTNEDGSFNTEEFILFGKKNKVDLVLFSNPNNPTGFGKNREEIIKIMAGFKDIIVLIDEAYIEFFDESVVNKVEEYKNLLVTRTLSKAFSGAALRVGFLIGNKKIIKKLNRFKVPFNVNSISQSFAIVLLDRNKRMEEIKEIVLKERERIYIAFKDIEELSKGRVKFYKSNGNFIFGRGDKGFLESFKSEGIQIRSFTNDTFRISIGSKEENNRVINILKEFILNG